MPTGLLIAMILSLIVTLVIGFSQPFKKKATKNFVLVIFGILFVYFAIGVLGSYGVIPLGSSSGLFLAVAPGAGAEAEQLELEGGVPGVIAGYQPTATFTTRDKFANTIVSGTSYYKTGNAPAVTTAPSNTNVGTSYTYWVQNGTISKYWTKPLTLTATTGVTNFVGEAWQNGTATVTLYDLDNHLTVTYASTSSENVTASANGQNNIELTYIGTSKQSASPFGGIFVVEYNNTVASVTCAGADLADVNPFHLTYSVSATTHVYKTIAYSSSLDNGLISSGKKITCQFIHGSSTPGAGAIAYFKFIPANYYVAQNGEILLDTEKFADSDNTRTGSTISLPNAYFKWD